MVLLCMLHVRSTVSIVFHTWSDKVWATNVSLSYFIFKHNRLVKYICFKSWCHSISIFMIIMYNYLVSITSFVWIYLTCMCIHKHSTRFHVSYTFDCWSLIFITRTVYMVYHNKLVSCIFHIIIILKHWFYNWVDPWSIANISLA